MVARFQLHIGGTNGALYEALDCRPPLKEEGSGIAIPIPWTSFNEPSLEDLCNCALFCPGILEKENAE